MSYSDTFSFQWDNFVNIFFTETKHYTPETMTVKRLNGWYESNSFKWSSIAEKEGVLLDNEKNERLSSELRKAIGEFRFTEIEQQRKPRIMPGLIIGAAAAVVLGVGLQAAFHAQIGFVVKLTPRVRNILIVVEAVVCMAAALLSYARRLDKHIKNEQVRCHDGYVQQLKDYKAILMSVCQKYE